MGKKDPRQAPLLRTLGNQAGGKITPVDDVKASAQQAVDLCNEQRDDLHAGRTPREQGDAGYTLRESCNVFLTCKMNKLESGELSRHAFADYQRTEPARVQCASPAA